MVDILNNTDDSAHVEKQIRNLDFTDIFETDLFHIDLSELESLENFVFPEKYSILYLNSISKWNIEIPEKHGIIYFKDILIDSNY